MHGSREDIYPKFFKSECHIHAMCVCIIGGNHYKPGETYICIALEYHQYMPHSAYI